MDMVEGRIVWEAAFPGLVADRARRPFRRDERDHRPAPQRSIPPRSASPTMAARPASSSARWRAGRSNIWPTSRPAACRRWTRLVDWLGAHLPPDSGDARIVHGDFRCDNMIFAADEPRSRRGARLGIVDARRSGRRLRLSSDDVPHAGGHVHRARRARLRRARHPVRGRVYRRLLPPHRAATICPTSII